MPRRPETGPLAPPHPAVAVPVPLWRVHAVIPCHNRPGDLRALLADLAALDLGQPAAARLEVTVIDNASDPPLPPLSPGLRGSVLPQTENRGGSGGYNAGIAHVLSHGIPGDQSELVWLLDSDVRLDPGALLPLLAALGSDPQVVAAGSALADPQSKAVFELGGRINTSTGEYEQPLPRDWAARPLIDVQYLAACSLLVRRHALERAGLFPDLFLNGDDVEWGLRLARRTGGRLVAVHASRAYHPDPDKMRTGARYYAARNAPYVLSAAAAPRRAILSRSLRETARALAQLMVGRDDLARLHLIGLKHALESRTGPAPDGAIRFEPFQKIEDLPAALRKILAAADAPRGRIMIRRGLLLDTAPVDKALNAACVRPVYEPAERLGFLSAAGLCLRRFVAGPRWGVALVSARARAQDWLCARIIVTVAPEGFAIRRIRRVRILAQAVATLGRGLWSSLKLALRPRPAIALPGPLVRPGGVAAPELSIVLLSYNRWPALEATLNHLRNDPACRGAQVIVADNGSTDGTRACILAGYPEVRFVELPENRGVAGFNEGVRRASGDLILILDDDSWPAPGVLGRAMAVVNERPGLGAVALHPRHPATQQSEWGFGESQSPRDDWPVMGCGNLVRRDVWDRAGGYDESFFLYRNDADLAMKILEAGYGVHFDPSLVVFHDSSAAAAKSSRWFRLATRNWVWLCRRHGRGLSRPAAAIMGWLHAHRLAGLNPVRHFNALHGLCSGLFSRPAQTPRGLQMDGAPMRTLLRVRFGR